MATPAAFTTPDDSAYSPRSHVRVSARGGATAVANRVEMVVRQNYSFVWRTAKGLGLSPSDAEDVAQSVMITVARRIEDVVEGNEKAFLFHTTKNFVRRHYRTHRRRLESVSERIADSEAPGAPLDELTEQRRLLSAFEKAMLRLPEKLRIPFILCEVEGCTKPEVADVLGIPTGTVASRIRRARRLFEEIVNQQGSGRKAMR